MSPISIIALFALFALVAAQPSCPELTSDVLKAGIDTTSAIVNGNIKVGKSGNSFTAKQSLSASCTLTLKGSLTFPDPEDGSFNGTFTDCSASSNDAACSCALITQDEATYATMTFTDTVNCTSGTISFLGQILSWTGPGRDSFGNGSAAPIVVASLALVLACLFLMF